MAEVSKAPKRRRSSILPRRSCTVTAFNTSTTTQDNTVISDNSVVDTKPCTVQQSPEENLSHNIRNLKCEYTAWKALLSERKLLKKSQIGMTVPPQLSLDNAKEFLNPIDMEFLNGAPSFEKIIENYDQLVKKVAWHREKYQRCSNLAMNLHRLVQSRLNVIKENIGEYSENNLDIPKL